LEESIAASLRRHERASEPDALEYLHRCINQFAELTFILAARSPIAPKPIRIGPKTSSAKSKPQKSAGTIGAVVTVCFSHALAKAAEGAAVAGSPKLRELSGRMPRANLSARGRQESSTNRAEFKITFNFNRGSFRTVAPAAEFSHSFGFYVALMLGYILWMPMLLLRLVVDLERFELSTS
jgi:hypothetical protein